MIRFELYINRTLYLVTEYSDQAGLDVSADPSNP